MEHDTDSLAGAPAIAEQPLEELVSASTWSLAWLLGHEARSLFNGADVETGSVVPHGEDHCVHGGSHVNVQALRSGDPDALLASRTILDRLAALIDSFPLAIIGVSPAGVIETWNGGATRLYGYRPDEALGQSIALLAPDGRRDAVHAVLDASAAGTPFTQFETIRRHKDGHTLTVALTVAAIRDRDGTLRGTASIAHDISDRTRAETALRESERKYRMLFEHMTAGFALCAIIIDEHGCPVDYRHLEVNPAFARLTGVPIATVLGKTAKEVLPGTEQHWIGVLGQVALTGEPAACQTYVRDLGKYFDGFAFSPAKGQFALVFTDITARKAAEARLAEQEAAYRRIVELAQEGIVVIDAQDRITFVNRRMADLLDYAPEDLLDHALYDFLDEEESRLRKYGVDLRRSGASGPMQFDMRVRRRDGQFIWLLASTVGLTDAGGQHSGALCMLSDITERKRAEDELRHAALHDALTGLPNRTLLNDRLDQGILHAQRAQDPLALLLLDLDRFNEINDTFGHLFGDTVLRHVARRLYGTLRATDSLARLGGDEFALVLPGDDVHGALRAAGSLAVCLAEPLLVEGMQVRVDTSVGVVVYPAHGHDAATLLRHADVAMYVAKRSHSGVSVYAPHQDYHHREHLALSTALPTAIRAGQLLLHYQPQVSLSTGELVGVEALVRWQHPERGLLLPGQFIGLAEHTGQMGALTAWVLQQAIEQRRAWGTLLAPTTRLAINISAANMGDLRLPDQVAQLLAEQQVAPCQLQLEVTEGMLLADQARAQAILARLTGTGIEIAIDDYGTGYSNLAYLASLMVHELKIDRSFVQDMARQAPHAAIVASTVGLGHSLGLRLVAEGVEDAATWEQLRSLGCDVAQGYFLTRPLPAQEFERWLQHRACASG